MKKHELSDKEVLQYIRQKTDKINSKFENKLKPLSTARNKKVVPGELKNHIFKRIYIRYGIFKNN